MAKPHEGRESLYQYLAHQFPWKQDYIAPDGDIISYEAMIEALKKANNADPNLYNVGAYRWLSSRARAPIADHFQVDGSTIKRLWDKLFDIIMNYARHSDQGITPIIDQIDDDNSEYCLTIKTVESIN